jgi:predicted nucleotide-binding protein
MPYYHIRVALVTIVMSPNTQYEYESDLLEEDVRKFAEDYQNSAHVFFHRKWIEVSEIAEVEIRETPEKTTYYFPSLGYSNIFQSSAFPDVTRKFLKSPPKRQIVSVKSERTAQLSSKNIFIVHGSDHKPVNELKTMLKEFGLDPLVLHEQASGGLTLAEKLEKYAGKVGFAFVILTPDDVGGQKEEIRKKLGADLPFLQRPIAIFGPQVIDNILKSFEPRARQNVIFEMGYFWGTLERKRVCFLLKGDVKKPSDIDGIAYVQFKESVNEVKTMIEKELTEAKYEIKK